MVFAWTALALWTAALAAAQPGYVGLQRGSADPAPSTIQYEYDEARREISRAEGSVQQWERRAETAPNEYERLKALRELEAARTALSSARRRLDEVRLRMRPGDGVWEKETDVERTGGFRIPSVGASGPVDPRLHQQHWLGPRGSAKGEGGVSLPVPPAAVVAVPAAGAVEYGRVSVPPGPLEGSGAWRWKERPDSPAPGGGPIEPPEEASQLPPSGGPPPRVVLEGVDFVGRELRWGFVPFGEKGGGLRPESREERALIRGVEEKARFGDYDAALESARRLKDLRPEDPRSHLLEARVLNHLGRFQAAREAARRALDLGLRSVELYETLAWSEAHLGLYEEAVRSAGEAIRLDPASGLAYMVRAFAYERLGRRDLREKDLRKAAALGGPAATAASAPTAKGPAPGRPDDGFRLLRRRAQAGPFPWGPAAGIIALALTAVGLRLRRRPK